MARRPALLTQAETQRVIRAAKKEGASYIDVKPDGTIRVGLSPQPTPEPVESREDVVL